MARSRWLVSQSPMRLLGIVLAFGLLATLSYAEEPKPPAGETKKEPKGKPNRLARETSPYLLLHAHNPVDWYPWGPEAFEKAKKDNKLIFLSIGYSSCYWCHVMERQSFQNEAIAKIMNEKFVCIKVDREERPDVDSIYMTALHVRGRRGGWPLSMFLAPDGKPIWGGTYWPPEDKVVDGETYSGFKTIVTEVNKAWEKNQKEMLADADTLADAVNRALAQERLNLVLVDLDRNLVKEVVEAVKQEYDPEHGGFGSPARKFAGPKFPQPTTPELLLAEHARTKDKELLKMVTHTLDRMARGGIYDHLGGGFHRYTVEREWKIPHFEKMLYDNGQLVSLYSKAYQVTKNPLYQRVVEETLAFIGREMTSPEGGFYSALDAETDAEEGKFYVWTAKEIDSLLPKADADLFKRAYAVDAGPNFEEKYNVLLLPKPLAEIATDLKMTEEQLLAQLKPLRQKLLDTRSKRERPLLDTKVLTSWNGLMIAGYADAARALENPAYAAKAERAAEFILKNMKSKDGRLLRTWGGGLPGVSQPKEETAKAKLNAYLEDYANLIHGLLALHDATGKKKWLDEAVALTEAMLKHYQDEKNGGFFFTSHDHEKLFARAKDQHDGATPSGNSIAALNLVRLAQKISEPRYRKHAEESFKAFTFVLKNSPEGMPAMANALALWLDAKEKKEPAGNNPKEPEKVDPKQEDPVKLSAAVMPEKPGADGKQTVTLTMEVAKGWHAYANPAGIDSLIPTTVTVNAKAKPEDVKVEYPKGREMKDPGLEQTVRVYEGKTEIKVSLRRAVIDGRVDESPLEVIVRYQVCDDKRCLPPKTVKLQVGSK